MSTLPLLLNEIIKYPVTFICTVLLIIPLHRLANRMGCYGLFKNLLFGVGGAGAWIGTLYLYIFLVRNFGIRSNFAVQILTGFGTAVFIIFVNRLITKQRPPAPATPESNTTGQ